MMVVVPCMTDKAPIMSMMPAIVTVGRIVTVGWIVIIVVIIIISARHRCAEQTEHNAGGNRVIATVIPMMATITDVNDVAQRCRF